MIDLHLHLDGSLSPDDILLLAKTAGVTLPCTDPEALRPLLEVSPDCRNLGEYLEKFDLPLQVLQTEKSIAMAVYLLLKRLCAQNLCYAEIRFAPQLHTAGGLSQKQVVRAAVSGLLSGIMAFDMPAQLILCCMRGDSNLQANLETVHMAKLFLSQGVCAVDLAGNEAAYPTERFAPVFALAKELEVPFIIHAGEAAGPESVRQAIALGAKRIGHGVRSIEDADLLCQLQQTQIPLEMCYTSNLQTKAATERSYPLAAYLDKGIFVTINTDNMSVSGTALQKEYRLLQQQFGLSFESLQALACAAADASFLPQEDKADLKSRIANDFAAWLQG